jgi:hypothetical protein
MARYYLHDQQGYTVGHIDGSLPQARAKAQRYANDDTHPIKLYKVKSDDSSMIQLVATIRPATIKKNPPSLNKWLPVTAVKFNRNGSVSMRVGRRPNSKLSIKTARKRVAKVRASTKWFRKLARRAR